MKICPNCGFEAQEEAKFCKNCGQKFDESIGVKFKGNVFIKQPLLMGISGIVIVLLVVILILVFNRPTLSKETIGQSNSSDSNSVSMSSKSSNSKAKTSSKETANWIDSDYIVISLFNKSTNTETVLSAGFGLTVNNSGNLVNVNDVNNDYWGQEFIDDKIQVKTKNYGKGNHYITIYNNGSTIATGENLCVDGRKTLLNVHSLMDLGDYSAQVVLKDSDIVTIEVS